MRACVLKKSIFIRDAPMYRQQSVSADKIYLFHYWPSAVINS